MVFYPLCKQNSQNIRECAKLAKFLSSTLDTSCTYFDRHVLLIVKIEPAVLDGRKSFPTSSSIGKER